MLESFREALKNLCVSSDHIESAFPSVSLAALPYQSYTVSG